LIKVSKDSDFSLVSNKNLSKILPSRGFGLGPDEVGHKGSLNKKPETKIKNFFFIADMKTCRIFWGFE